MDHLPVLGVTHGHLGGPGTVAASPFSEPTTAAAAGTAQSGTTLAAFRATATDPRAEGGPADDPAALRRAAPPCGPAGRPILPVDARLQNESLDASDAHDTLSDCMFPFPPTPRRSSSARRSSMDGKPPLAAAGSLFLTPLSAVDAATDRSSLICCTGCCCCLSLPAAAPAAGFGDVLRAAPPPTLGPTTDMPS